MKDFIISVIILAILIVIFSTGVIPDNLMHLGVIPQCPGDSGMVMPGNGSDPAEPIVVELQKNDTEREDNKSEESSASSKESGKENNNGKSHEEFYIEITKREQYSMSEILVAFWHGAASVLLGEACTLLIIVACKKIFGKKTEV